MKSCSTVCIIFPWSPPSFYLSLPSLFASGEFSFHHIYMKDLNLWFQFILKPMYPGHCRTQAAPNTVPKMPLQMGAHRYLNSCRLLSWSKTCPVYSTQSLFLPHLPGASGSQAPAELTWGRLPQPLSHSPVAAGPLPLQPSWATHISTHTHTHAQFQCIGILQLSQSRSQ